jgi:sirohydrochlorin ferrochelatase
MKYPDAETLIHSFQRTHWLMKKQTDGLTHDDSLLQPPFRSNCLNWVLGHILVSRNTCLSLLGQPMLWSEAERARYKRGSEPIIGNAQALRLDKLLADLDESQRLIQDALEQISPEGLAAAAGEDEDDDRNLGQRLAGVHWHETYHTGQLEILRQLAGTNDAVIR